MTNDYYETVYNNTRQTPRNTVDHNMPEHTARETDDLSKATEPLKKRKESVYNGTTRLTSADISKKGR